MVYATIQDVADELGRTAFTDPAEIAQLNAWLRRANAAIKVRVPDLDARVDSGSLSAEVVASIEAAAVARKAQNPKGLRSVMRSVDDGSIQETVDSTRSDGVIRIMDDEWMLLLGRQTRGAFSVRPAWSWES